MHLTYGVQGSLVTYTGNNEPTKFIRGVFGSKVGGCDATTYVIDGKGLHNWNSKQGINIEKNGYAAKFTAEWNLKADGSGTAFDHSESNYDAQGFAGVDLTNGDQTVTLYVNWEFNPKFTINFYANGAETNYGETLSSQLLRTSEYRYLGTNWSEEAGGPDYYGENGTWALIKNGYIGTNYWLIGSNNSEKKISATVQFPTMKDVAEEMGLLDELNNGDITVDLYAEWVEASYAEYNENTLIKNYATLAKALSGVTDGNIIKPLKDVTDESTTNPTLANGKSVTLDLNGKAVSLNGVYLINQGILDIYNSQSTEATLQSSGTYVIRNQGTITVNNTASTNKTTIQNTSTSSNSRVILNDADKDATLNTNTYLKFTQATTGVRYIVTTNGTLTIAGANITNKDLSSTVTWDRGIQVNNSNGRINITSGTIDTSGTSLMISDVATSDTANICLEISGGTILSEKENAIYDNHAKNKIIISGGTIRTAETRAIVNENMGSIYISGGEIISTTTRDMSTVRNNGGGTITITDGQIISTNSSAVVNYSGELKITGGIIKSSNTSARGVGVNIKGGTTTITGGNIMASYGICYTEDNSPVINVGTDDNEVKTDTPVITGASIYGIKVGNAIFNFYDGVIKGPTAIYGTVSGKPNEYSVMTTTSDSVQTAILSR